MADLSLPLSNQQDRKPFAHLINDQVDALIAESMHDRTNRGSSRSGLAVLTGQRGLEATLKIYQADGRVKHHLIRVTQPRHGTIDELKVEVEVSWSDNDEMNAERLRYLQMYPNNVLIVNHRFYQLGSPASNLDEGEVPVQGPGFGGRTIKFRRLLDSEDGNTRSAGPVMATRNLWSSGIVAPAWHERLPDNAVFLDGFDGPGVNY